MNLHIMNLHINGDEHAFADPAPPAQFTLASLIESLSMKPDRVAVELNRNIVPRDRWSHTPLKDGDRLEIVHFVGGGCCALPLRHSSS
jgi:sulfur carrier protein